MSQSIYFHFGLRKVQNPPEKQTVYLVDELSPVRRDGANKRCGIMLCAQG